jgi:hypothetical protein
MVRQKNVVDGDAPIFNMLRTKFRAYSRMLDMKDVNRFIAIDVNCPTEEEAAKKVGWGWRTAINGWAARLAIYLLNDEIFQFDEAFCGNLTDMAALPNVEVNVDVLLRQFIVSRDEWLRRSTDSMSQFMMSEPPD